jgi:hypothetical protein
MRIARFTAMVLMAALVLAPAATALAHSPVFPEENHSPATAYQINDPAKSWAVYNTLEHDNSGDYYRFTVSKGDKIQLSLIVPDNPSNSGFLPSMALLVPDQTQKDGLPVYVEVPADYGAIVVNGTDPGQATYEAFSPGWFYEVGNLALNAPADGAYLVVVFNHMHNDDTHNHTHEAANYGLVVGYLESFTPLELIMVSYSVQEVYRWEGQSQFIVLLPLILMLIIGGVVLYWRSRQDRAPKGISQWLAAFAGLAFLGSAVSIIYQMLLALGVTGVTREAFITLILIVISIILALFTFMYAIRGKPTLTLRRRVALIVIGIIALFGWSGLYIGPALVIAAALIPPYAAKNI